MGPKTLELCSTLRTTIQLLEEANESHWSKWLSVSLGRIENGDFSGIEHLLGAFGGMGSFNDLILCAANSHSIPDDKYGPVNKQLDALRIELFAIGRLR